MLLKKKLDNRPSLKRRLCQLTSVMLCSCPWSLKMGPIGCPETLVRNYHSVLHTITQKCRSHMII